MEQRVEKLSVVDEEHLARRRDWLLGHYNDGKPSVYHESYASPLVLVETILAEGWIKPSETWKLQCLGIAVGDALQRYLGLEWVAVEDEHGRDPALRDHSGILVFPLTMISKRVERGEQVDVIDLFKKIVAMLRERRGDSN